MNLVKVLLPGNQWHKKVARAAIIGLVSAMSVSGLLALSIYFYSHQKTTQQTDAAIVLGAAVWDSEPSPVFRERINHAIHLYKKGQIKNIIFTGGQGEVDEQAEAIVAKKYALERGVLAKDILTETRSRTTYQNLYYAKLEISDRPLTKFLIVSDPLHMKRAIVMAQDIGMNAYPSPTPTTRYKTLNTQLEFLRRETLFYGLYLVSRLFGLPENNPDTF